MTDSEKDSIERLLLEMSAACRTLRRLEKEAREAAESYEINMVILRDRLFPRTKYRA